MDWFPLYNSLRIALVSSIFVFFTGIFAAYYIAKLPPAVKGILDVVLTLPLVLPPTVVGYFLLMILGPRRLLGTWFLQIFDTKLVMTWYAGIFAASIVAFPLMYRTARGAFESFDQTLAYAGQTLGLSNSLYFLAHSHAGLQTGNPGRCGPGICTALGEYGATSMVAGYTPGKTATISTTVYQLWRTNNDTLAFRWVLVNVVISAVVLLLVNLLEKKECSSGKSTSGK